MRASVRRLALVLALASAAPGLAYTIFLKDGSQILAKQKYVVRGDKAIITLPSGTETAIAATEIDVARTEQANLQDLGTAILIDDGKSGRLPSGPAATPRQPEIGDLIRRGGAGVRDEGVAPGAPGAAATPPATGVSARPRGFEDRPTVTRTPLRDTDLAGAIRAYIGERGLPVEVVQGPTPRRPLLVFETESEGNVFRALLASAAALVDTQKRFPGAVDSVEMICQTSDGNLAARFTLSPQQAADLLAQRLEITRFFVDYVQF